MELISQNLSTDTAFPLLHDYTQKLLKGITPASDGHIKTEVGVKPSVYGALISVSYITNEKSETLVQLEQNDQDPDMWDVYVHDRIVPHINDKLELNFTKFGMVHSHLHF